MQLIAWPSGTGEGLQDFEAAANQIHGSTGGIAILESDVVGNVGEIDSRLTKVANPHACACRRRSSTSRITSSVETSSSNGPSPDPKPFRIAARSV